MSEENKFEERSGNLREGWNGGWSLGQRMAAATHTLSARIPQTPKIKTHATVIIIDIIVYG